MTAGALDFLTAEPPRAAPARVSATLLGAAEKCMLLAKAERENPAGSAPSSAGRVFHEAAGVVATYAYARDLRRVPAEDALRLADQVIRNPEEPGALARHDANRVRGMVARWARWMEFEIGADIFAVEMPLVTELEGVLFSGRADLLTITGTHCEITDYKSGQYVPTVKEVEEHSQLPTYAVAAAARWPQLRTFLLREVYVVGWPKERPVYVEDTHIPALEDWMLDVHGRITAAYRKDEFDAAPGPWCANCPIKFSCPVPPEARPESIADVDHAVAVASRLIVNTARVDTDRTSLKAFLDGAEIPALIVNGSRVGWRDTTRRELNKGALEQDIAAGEARELEDYYVEKDGREFTVATK